MIQIIEVGRVVERAHKVVRGCWLM